MEWLMWEGKGVGLASVGEAHIKFAGCRECIQPMIV